MNCNSMSESRRVEFDITCCIKAEGNCCKWPRGDLLLINSRVLPEAPRKDLWLLRAAVVDLARSTPTVLNGHGTGGAWAVYTAG